MILIKNFQSARWQTFHEISKVFLLRGLRVLYIPAFLFAQILGSTEGRAVPAYAVQTELQCSACHVGGFGPQLTPLGRQFKLDGYTMRATPEFTPPVSAMAMASYIATAKGQSPPPAPHYAANDNSTLDQASLFVAGGYGEHFGSFAQFTYDGIGRAVSWDNLDLRATDRATLADQDVVFGLVLNNNPGVEDSWNTLAAWGFPYSSSDLVPAPAAGTIMSGALAQTVLGLNAYAWWNSSLYTEIGFYWTPDRGFLRAMGVDSSDPGALANTAPYLRLAYQKDYGEQNFEVGGFGFFPAIYPGNDHTTGKSDHYRDLGLDASYQYIGSGENIYQLNAAYTNEHQSLDASSLLGASRNSDSLNDLRFDGSYYWHNEIGATIQHFDTWGSTDALLYAGTTALKPNSSGFVFQIDGTPFGETPSELGPRINLRVGIQYIAYTKFDGASSNYDGLGRSASDNNTIRLFIWSAF